MLVLFRHIKIHLFLVGYPIKSTERKIKKTINDQRKNEEFESLFVQDIAEDRSEIEAELLEGLTIKASEADRRYRSLCPH